MNEMAMNAALEGIAAGATRGEVQDYVMLHFKVKQDEVNQLLDESLKEALAQGVEREDIDDSWF